LREIQIKVATSSASKRLTSAIDIHSLQELWSIAVKDSRRLVRKDEDPTRTFRTDLSSNQQRVHQALPCIQTPAKYREAAIIKASTTSSDI